MLAGRSVFLGGPGLLACLLVLALGHAGQSMPFTDVESLTSAPVSTTTAATRAPRPISSLWRYREDYVDSDQEWARILDTLQAEAANSVHHPQNYVSDDLPIEEVVKLIESGVQLQSGLPATSTQATTTSTDASGQTTGASPLSPNTETSAGATKLDCPICQDEIASASHEARLACGHKFHRDCLGKWFIHRAHEYRGLSCPMCRAEVSNQSEYNPGRAHYVRPTRTRH